MPFLKKICVGLVYFVYALLAAAVFSGSFGTAVAVSLSIILCIFACLVILRSGFQFRLLAYEGWLLLLLAWLLVIAGVNWNARVGVRFVLLEYRTLIMAPLISFALSRLFSARQIWMPFIVGSIFNLFGSVILVGSKYFGLHGFQVLQHWLGVVADGKGSQFALDGKFIQACLMAVWSGVSFSWFRQKHSYPQVFHLVIVGVLLPFIFYHGVVLVDSMSGLFVGLGTLAAMSLLIILNIDSRMLRYGVICIAGLVGVLILIEVSSQQRVATALINLQRFMFDDFYDSSIGLRLLTYKRLEILTWDQLMFGVGAGSSAKIMLEMFPVGTVGHILVEWNDFHSQFIWLIVKGGLVSLCIYFAAIWDIVKKAIKLVQIDRMYALGGLGVAISAVLLFMGSMNSLFTAISESHFLGLLLILFGSLYRIHRSKTVS